MSTSTSFSITTPDGKIKQKRETTTNDKGGGTTETVSVKQGETKYKVKQSYEGNPKKVFELE